MKSTKIVIAALVLSTIAEQAFGDGAELRLVLDRRDVIGPAKTLEELFWPPRAAEGGRLAFFETDSGPVYAWVDGVLQRVSDRGGPAPDDPSLRFSRYAELAWDGETLVFDASTYPGLNDGLYVYRAGSFQKIFREGEMVPGLDEPIGSPRGVSLRDGAVVFGASGRIWEWQDGNFAVLVGPETPLPHTEGTFGTVSSPVSRGNRTVFWASGEAGVAGLYEISEGRISLLLLQGTPYPSEGPIQGTTPRAYWFDFHGRTLAFIGPRRALFSLVDGRLEKVADKAVRAAVGRRKVAFSYWPNLFGWEPGGSVFAIGESGSVVEGSVVHVFEIEAGAFAGGEFFLGGAAVGQGPPPIEFHSAHYAARFVPDCEDGVDNDGDGLADFPEDPECEHAADNSERVAIRVRHRGRRPIATVAILSREGAEPDAIDLDSLAFGPEEVRPLLPFWHFLHRRDVDGDGSLDQILYFRVDGETFGSRETACLNGRIEDQPFEACAEIAPRLGCGLGGEAGLAAACLVFARRAWTQGRSRKTARSLTP